jgi:phosphoribosylformimino-5-aminoimidazole carboxamide ribotide isomerase
LCLEWGSDRVVVAVDARDGMVAIEGWTEGTSVASADLMRGMMDAGVSRFLYTDISRDGTLGEPNFEALQALLGVIHCPIQASGGVSREEHLARLASMGVEGAIVGRALYTGDLDLRAAVRAADNG